MNKQYSVTDKINDIYIKYTILKDIYNKCINLASIENKVDGVMRIGIRAEKARLELFDEIYLLYPQLKGKDIWFNEQKRCVEMNNEYSTTDCIIEKNGFNFKDLKKLFKLN